MTVLGRQQTEIAQGVLIPAGGPLIGQEYFAIKDQTGRVWYWWISYGLSPDWDDQPEKEFDQEVRFYFIPWWLSLRDAEGVSWYVYPEVDGSPLVSPDQPAAGEGIAGSPPLRVRGGALRYRYTILGGGLDVSLGVLPA